MIHDGRLAATWTRERASRFWPCAKNLVQDRTVQVFIASADRKLRLALLLLLETEPGMVVTGLTDRTDGLPGAITSSQPDVLLLDNQLAGAGAVEFIRSLQALNYPPRIIVLALDPQANDKLLAAGAHAVIGTNMPPDDLLPLLRGIRNSYRSKPSSSAEEHNEDW